MVEGLSTRSDLNSMSVKFQLLKQIINWDILLAKKSKKKTFVNFVISLA